MDEQKKFKVAAIVKVRHGELTEFLRQKGWTQHHLAHELGVRDMDVSNWMQMRNFPRKPEVLQKLMELTGKSAFDLFPEFMREPGWKEIIDRVPKEYVFVRKVEVKALAGGKILALPSAEDEYIAKKEFGKHLYAALDNLATRERRVLELRFGLGEEDVHTLEEVGAKLRISRDRVRQIQNQAIRKLRHPKLSRFLRDFRDLV